MKPEQAALFADGDLDDETGLFAVQGRTAGPPVTEPTMTKAEVREWLGVSNNDLKQATTRQTIRRVSPGRFLTASVTRHLPGVAVCNLAQTCAVLDRSPSWLRRELGRLGLVADPVGATYRVSRVSVNKVAVQLRRVDALREEKAAIRELDTLTDTVTREAKS
ncbi:hypothetical protein CVAR_2312 [Corynebacterium variabile DSM 44702]|uniref:Uncharacterized protein n=1 Tax=Corynebacterium variabile (strain DSM 44702 / CIP 107183 / JCM 12073 / NCIMB 30131) TaxID=858619 RepID=G0HGQ0_CORVD|nr:hypothetical protein [Corynebacterium variabile]AEK37657.1 hypothetical protein CVAR_2312 [Corynebacterium variabile DSM 44702]